MMKTGLAAWGLRETPLAEQLTMTVRLRQELLELGIMGHPNDFLQADAAEIQYRQAESLFQSAGLIPICAATGNDFTQPDETVCRRELEQAKAALKIATRLNIRFLRVFAGFAPVEEVSGRRWEVLLDCLEELYAAAAKTGVIPVVETHGGVEVLADGAVRHFHSVTTVKRTLDELINRIPSMRLNFDPANLAAVGVDAAAFFRQYRERIDYIHLKDFIRSGSGLRPVACGEGIVNWAELMAAIHKFTGPVLLEYEIPADIEAGFQRSLNFIQKMEG